MTVYTKIYFLAFTGVKFGNFTALSSNISIRKEIISFLVLIKPHNLKPLSKLSVLNLNKLLPEIIPDISYLMFALIISESQGLPTQTLYLKTP